MKKMKILLTEDEYGARFGFVRYFTAKEGFEVVESGSIKEAEDALTKDRFDAAVLDINLPDGNGLDLIGTIRSYDSTIPIIVITGSGDIPLAVDAMRKGADNFLTKPVDNASLAVFLRKSLEISVLKRQQDARSMRLKRRDDIFFGDDPIMQEVLYHAQMATKNDHPVLITGETGTGKGMLAKWIHRNSARSDYELVEVNCSSLRGEMLARELFGNTRGAFTSADQDRKGLLDVADRGTLFLDEIGDMGSEIQAQFLKVLEDKTYRRLGDIKLRRSDFRLISATNRDIEALVQEGGFRQDLMYRINLMAIHLPPLRQRLDDLETLTPYLLRASDQTGAEVAISDEVMALLKSYSWPGNIRELKNVLERAVILAQGGELKPVHFAGLRARMEVPPPPTQQITRQQQEDISVALREANGDVAVAAKNLGISRATLYRRLGKMQRA